MNDLFYVGLGMTAILAGLIAFVGFLIYNEMYNNLSNAKVGEVYNFDYEQPFHGEKHRILAKVIEPVYVLDDLAIKKLNRRSAYRRNDPIFHRTKHLVTCKTFDGEVRQFYAERASNVRRCPFGGLLMKTGLASLLF